VGRGDGAPKGVRTATLSKALNVGRPIRVQSHRAKRELGTVVTVNSEKGFGIIRGGRYQVEYYFKLSDVDGGKPHIGQKVSFNVYMKYGKQRAKSVRHSK
jgi:cold shock CspA family protein